jgi:fatty-acyl-CoA synthase
VTGGPATAVRSGSTPELPASLWDALTADHGSATLSCWVDGRYVPARWTEVARDAERMTAGLRAAGVAPGARVATVLTNTPHAVRGVLGTWLAGGCLASFPLPARGIGPAEYAGQLRTLIEHHDPAALLLDAPLLALLPPELRARVNARSWESVADSGRVPASPPGDDEVAFVQYSSGSTAAPKGSMLTPRAMLAQLRIVAAMTRMEPSDVGVTWLPLSHDMGLFGCLLAPWSVGMRVYLSTPERFSLAPGSWLADLAETGSTIACGTNTALALAARRVGSRGLSGPLRLHTMILGAERVEWEALQSVLRTLGPHGLRPEALMPAYGLAEATLAVTSTPRDEPPRQLTVDGVALADGEIREVAPDDAAATAIVSSGVPCPGVRLGGLTGDGVREIQVSSPSLAVGYFGDPDRSADRFRDGVLHTGDIGFVRDGHLYPVGRLDDVLSIGGRKVYAREIESAVDDLDGVRRGCSALVETHDGRRQRLTLLLEVTSSQVDTGRLADRAAALAMSKAAVALDRCLFLAKGTMPKTPSGKIQRYRCRQMLDAGQFEPLRTVELAGV